MTVCVCVNLCWERREERGEMRDERGGEEER